MKKIVLLMAVMIGTVAVHADDYTYLTFEKSDGTLTSVALSSLSITISGTTLTAGDQTFTLSDLTKMYFSTANETTGIEEATTTLDGAVEVFSLNGIAIGKYASMKDAAASLKTGIYVIKSKSKTLKVAVK